MDFDLSFGGLLDDDVITHPVTWLFIIGGFIAFGMGFKLAEGGAFGLVTAPTDIALEGGGTWGWPWYQKAMIIGAWPVVVYIFMRWKLR